VAALRTKVADLESKLANASRSTVTVTAVSPSEDVISLLVKVLRPFANKNVLSHARTRGKTGSAGIDFGVSVADIERAVEVVELIDRNTPPCMTTLGPQAL
jgi:hypothetical protein